MTKALSLLEKQRLFNSPLEWHLETGLITNAHLIQEGTGIWTQIAAVPEAQQVSLLMTGWTLVLALIVGASRYLPLKPNINVGLGSMVGPAAACGIFGLRPTHGGLSNVGALAVSSYAFLLEPRIPVLTPQIS